MLAGKPRFRTVAGDLDAARRQRELLVAAAEAGALAVSPRLRFATVVDRWLARFEARVAAGERRERTLEAHRYHMKKHLLPTLRIAKRTMLCRVESASAAVVSEQPAALRRVSSAATSSTPIVCIRRREICGTTDRPACRKSFAVCGNSREFWHVAASAWQNP